MMYEHLVKNLRDDTALQNCEFDFVHAWMHEAADAIEELKKQLDNSEIENIKLKEEFAKYRGKNRWIPVTERLPNVDEKVLTFARNKYDGSWFMDITSWTGVRNHDEYQFWGYGYSMKVTHWMPLPEPPKDGEA